MAVFKRDGFVCTQCGDSSKEINAHHVKRFVDILRENSISTTEEAEKCADLWNVDNGRTLCIRCHKKTETYGNKKVKNDVQA